MIPHLLIPIFLLLSLQGWGQENTQMHASKIFSTITTSQSKCLSKIISENFKNESIRTSGFLWENPGTVDNLKVAFISLHSQLYPVPEKLYYADILDYSDSDSLYFLNKNQSQELFRFIKNNNNFEEGECGTFFLNGGFFVFKANRLVGVISMGCFFNQWVFNPIIEEGRELSHVNKTGLTKMTKLLDEIYLSMEKK